MKFEKGSFFTLFKKDEGEFGVNLETGFIAVTGYRSFNYYGLHESISGKWVVTDRSTGYALASYATKKDALADEKTWVERIISLKRDRRELYDNALEQYESVVSPRMKMWLADENQALRAEESKARQENKARQESKKAKDN